MGDNVAVVAVAGGIVIALVAIIGGFTRESTRLKEREKSRREIAAYIAEGTMTADEGERLMNADGKSKTNC